MNTTRAAAYEPPAWAGAASAPAEQLRRSGLYYGLSILRARFPDGFRKVGVDAQPLAVKLPYGWRVFPNTPNALWQKLPTGQWVHVVWRL